MLKGDISISSVRKFGARRVGELNPLIRADNDERGNAHKQPTFHHARNIMQLPFKLKGIGNRGNMHIYYIVAVVRHKRLVMVFTKAGLPSPLFQMALCGAPAKGNDFDW